MLSDRMHGYAPDDEARDELLIQTFTIRKWATEAAQLETENARLRERKITCIHCAREMMLTKDGIKLLPVAEDFREKS